MRDLLAHPALCSRAHVYRHYDAEVRGEALLRPGEADAGVCRPIPGTTLGVAVSLDGNARWCDLDPYHGGGGDGARVGAQRRRGRRAARAR